MTTPAARGGPESQDRSPRTKAPGRSAHTLQETSYDIDEDPYLATLQSPSPPRLSGALGETRQGPCGEARNLHQNEQYGRAQQYTINESANKMQEKYVEVQRRRPRALAPLPRRRSRS